MGLHAMRENHFLDAFLNQSYTPISSDEIRVESLRKIIGDYNERAKEGVLYNFGVSEKRTGFEFLTYQFAHANLWHLMSNIVLLALLGFILEELIGWVLLPLYFVCGWGGALFHLKEAVVDIPLVGASAAITGFLGYLIFIQPRKNIRYFYFFSPFQGHYGYIFMPVWVLVPISVVGDIVGWLSQGLLVKESVGYTAHIGGFLVGAAVALLTHSLTLSKYRISRPKKETRL
jgi:membrane associated rhomboid family serine protease